nr:MAG TPA: hypothetical protein [Caudoviricetes sp.]
MFYKYYYMECAEVGSSNGLENRGDRKVNSSMLSHSAIFCEEICFV